MNTPTLESVQNDFQQWRQHKPYLRSSTPADLRDKALSLRGQYSVPAICKTLGITRSMLQTWLDAATEPPREAQAPIEFVVLPTPTDDRCDKAKELELTITRVGGDQWCLRGDPSAEQLHTFVTALTGGGS